MDVQQYIYSGVLEDYCLGLLNEEQQAEVVQMCLLHPRVKQELNNIELAFEYFAQDNERQPKPSTKQNILDTLEPTFAKITLDINNLPEISQRSDIDSWLRAVEHLIPKHIEDFLAQVLRSENGITQMLVISKIDVPEESHSDLQESLYILKGECACTIGSEVIEMGAGDFIDIPLHIHHDVKVLSPYVIAIVQHKAIAA